MERSLSRNERDQDERDQDERDHDQDERDQDERDQEREQSKQRHNQIPHRSMPTILNVVLGASDTFAVKSSDIHGNGVFAQRPIPKRTIITFYDGENIDRNTALKRSDKRYMRTVSFAHHVIDGLRVPVVGRGAGSFVNHSVRPNACFWVRHDRVWVKALRDIEDGEEIVVNYGRTYWRRAIGDA